MLVFISATPLRGGLYMVAATSHHFKPRRRAIVAGANFSQAQQFGSKPDVDASSKTMMPNHWAASHILGDVRSISAKGHVWTAPWQELF
jgi:hypothetical protein